MPEEKKDKESWLDLIKFGIICVLIVVPFRIFVAQPYVVEGSSMDPTFKDGDYLIVDQISYNFEKPERGDVIILKYPSNPKRFLIKRVIGLPGETVVIKNGKVYIRKNGEEFRLEENYVVYGKIDNLEFNLKDKEYFVMGDNRAGSSDSRAWGTLPEENVVGKPILRLLPLNSISLSPGK